jgi:SAM-dependent methyltransferase
VVELGSGPGVGLQALLGAFPGAHVIGDMGPVDLVVAVHVLYFWHRPERDLAQIAGLLAGGGRLVLGYQLRPHMPAPAQRDFPIEGHRLYESDDDVRRVVGKAGFEVDDVTVFGDPARLGGRLLLAARPGPDH